MEETLSNKVNKCCCKVCSRLEYGECDNKRLLLIENLEKEIKEKQEFLKFLKHEYDNKILKYIKYEYM